LGIAEENAYQTLQQLSQEEMRRLQNIQKTLQLNRPMENDRNSILGNIEAFVVGIIRAPKLMWRVFQRVQELLNSSNIPVDVHKNSNDNQNTTLSSNMENNKNKNILPNNKDDDNAGGRNWNDASSSAWD
jgi:hypothetical protein